MGGGSYMGAPTAAWSPVIATAKPAKRPWVNEKATKACMHAAVKQVALVARSTIVVAVALALKDRLLYELPSGGVEGENEGSPRPVKDAGRAVDAIKVEGRRNHRVAAVGRRVAEEVACVNLSRGELDLAMVTAQ